LAGRARLLGSDDRDVLVTSSNLALACEAIGQTERALRLLTDAITVAEASPRDQRFLLMGLENNLGALLQDLDRDLEAVPHLERAAELAGVVLGDDHPDTLTIRQNLAGLEAELGDPERAAALLAELVEQRTALLGPAAPDVLETRHGYWNALWQAERFDEAAEGFAELLDDVVAALGDGHPLAAQTRVSLARTLFDLGLPAEALPIAEQAAEGIATRFGETHSRTRSARHLVRSIRAQLGE
jgi:tetratricopeptide (TPR) repeat protein